MEKKKEKHPVYKLVWFLALFIAGLVLVLTVPEGTAGPASALEPQSRAGGLDCPFELTTLDASGTRHAERQGGGQ